MNRSDTIRAHGDARQACMTGLIPAQPSFLLVVSALCARQRKPDTAYLKSARRPRTLTRTNPPLSPRQPLKLMEMEGSFLWGRLTRQQPFSTLPYGSGCWPDLQNGERFASRVEDLSQVSPGRMCNADAKRFTQRRAGTDLRLGPVRDTSARPCARVVYRTRISTAHSASVCRLLRIGVTCRPYQREGYASFRLDPAKVITRAHPSLVRP